MPRFSLHKDSLRVLSDADAHAVVGANTCDCTPGCSLVCYTFTCAVDCATYTCGDGCGPNTNGCQNTEIITNCGF